MIFPPFEPLTNLSKKETGDFILGFETLFSRFYEKSVHLPSRHGQDSQVHEGSWLFKRSNCEGAGLCDIDPALLGKDKA